MMELELLNLHIPGFALTPTWLAEDMVEIAEIKQGMKVLEPSAGSARIADAIKRSFPTIFLDLLEINSTLCQFLGAKGYHYHQWNFLEWKHKPQVNGEEPGYNRILMYPPYAPGQDIEHVWHAFGLLASGGRLVSIMSEGSFFRRDKQALLFGQWLERVGGKSKKLPDGIFRESGGEMQSRLVVINKASHISAPPLPSADPAQDQATLLAWLKELYDQTPSLQALEQLR